mgnify:FL=1
MPTIPIYDETFGQVSSVTVLHKIRLYGVFSMHVTIRVKIQQTRLTMQFISLVTEPPVGPQLLLNVEVVGCTET